MTNERASIRRYFWVILIVGTIAGLGVAHGYYYFSAKAEVARELAVHPDRTAANYQINY